MTKIEIRDDGSRPSRVYIQGDTLFIEWLPDSDNLEMTMIDSTHVVPVPYNKRGKYPFIDKRYWNEFRHDINMIASFLDFYLTHFNSKDKRTILTWLKYHHKIYDALIMNILQE